MDPDAMRRPRGGLRAKAGGMGGGSLTSNAEEVRSSVEYRQYEEMGCEIRDALLQVRQQAREEAAAAAAPKAAVTCPYCGATHTGCQRLLPSFAAVQSTDKNTLEQ